MSKIDEIRCLEMLKRAYYGKSEKHIIFNNANYKEFTSILSNAVPNNNHNVFPDFIFYGGGIEHFQLTSSKETKKGSEFAIEENANKNARDNYRSNVQKEFTSSEYTPGTLTTCDYEEIYDNFSYDDFLYSLERNISKHVNSLEKSGYQDKLVVFLMEQQTARLWIDEGTTPISFYELHKDKKALLLIKELCKHVNCLVYCVSDSIEIIDVSKIDELLEKAAIYKNIRGGRLVVREINLLIDL